jgi:hypothetical protein
MKRCFNLQLSSMVVVFTVIKIIIIGLYVNYSWNIIKIQLHTVKLNAI